MAYHGGPTMVTNPMTVFAVYYGTSFTYPTTGQTVFKSFMQNVGASNWWNLMSQYTNAQGQPSAIPSYGSEYMLNPALSRGTNLVEGTTTAVAYVVVDAFNQGLFPSPPDPNALYYVLGDASIHSAFSNGQNNYACASNGFCGWHSSATISLNGVNYNIKYSFIGSAMTCYNGPYICYGNIMCIITTI